MMKKTKLIRSCVMALFVLVALLLVYLVVRQTMPVSWVKYVTEGTNSGSGMFFRSTSSLPLMNRKYSMQTVSA